MVLIDTSVWVDHLSKGNDALVEMLHEGLVASHPFVIGELACGQMRNRNEILGLLSALPQVRLAEHDELLALVNRHRLFGKGLGWVDVHLLGSTHLSACTLWTLDKALADAAKTLGVSADLKN